MVELLVALAGRIDEDAQVGLDLVLADELVERLRAEAVLEEDVLFRPDRAQNGGHAVVLLYFGQAVQEVTEELVIPVLTCDDNSRPADRPGILSKGCSFSYA